MVSVLGDQAKAQGVIPGFDILTAEIRCGLGEMDNAQKGALGQRSIEDVRLRVGARIGGESLAQPYFAKRSRPRRW